VRKGTIGECFLVAVKEVKLVINSAAKRAVLAFVHLNADLWTRKGSHQKFLVVRIFWKSDPELKTALLAVTSLAVTSYAPPKVEDKVASEWLLEYVLTVLKWYGVEPSHVKGETIYPQNSICGKIAPRAVQLLPTSPSGAQRVTIMTLGVGGI
jgi:hypothetical protein